MKETANPILAAISQEIEIMGFTRKSNNWTRASAEVSQVINLQKSNYGRQYYINLGFLPKEMAQDSTDYAHPRHEKCPVRLRIEDILPNPAQEIAETLDLEKEIFTPHSRAKRVGEFMASIAPTLDRLLTIEGLRRAYADGTFKRALIMLRARALLGESE
jgi:Domain of unknown function (DUF4304)